MKTRNNYKLSKIETNPIFGYLVLLTNYIGFDNCIFDVEQDLKKTKFKGRIVIDLLPLNGISDRFYSLNFDGTKFNYNSISNIQSLDSEIERLSSNFYLSHFDIIEKLSISRQSKFLIKRELTSRLNVQYSKPAY